MMVQLRAILSTSTVIILCLVASFALLYVLSGKNKLSLSDECQIDLTSSFKARLWGMLLGLSAGGFSVGPSLAPENEAVRNLFSSYGGDWFLLVTAALVLIGLVGGLLAKHALRGALSSGIALLILAFVGIFLTSTELPNLARDLNLPSGSFSQFLSAVEISQVAGGCFAALVASIMGALGGRALQYREKVPIDAIKPPLITFIKPSGTEEEKKVEPDIVPSSEPASGKLDEYKPIKIELDIRDTSSSLKTLDQGESGPLSRSPPCPHCGNPLVWIPESKRYYCKVCATYP
ncbi:MAG: hypothetical protein ACUVTL_03895 [Thermoproteota archaeon]